jgi:hypothetical protein
MEFNINFLLKKLNIYLKYLQSDHILSNPNQNRCSKFRSIFIGLSSGYLPNGSCVGLLPNSYAILDGRNYCWLSSEAHNFEWPNGEIKPAWNGQRDVIGCGLALNPENKLSIFLTGNGILMGQSFSDS